MIKSSIKTITPKKAEEMLGSQIRNRYLSDALITLYARDMKQEHWDENGQSIIISEDGMLIDGQHRLNACIRAGVPFRTVVTYGVEEKAKLTIDSGKKRSFAHQLQMDGIGYSNHLAATVQTIFHILEGSTATRLTNHEMQKILDKYPDILDSTRLIMSQIPLVPKPSILSAVHFLASHFLSKRDSYTGQDMASEFHKVFYTGVPFYKPEAGASAKTRKDPAHIWRERLIKIMAKPHAAIPRKSVIDGTVHAWNLFIKGETPAYFKIPKDVTMEGLPSLKKIRIDFNG